MIIDDILVLDLLNKITVQILVVGLVRKVSTTKKGNPYIAVEPLSLRVSESFSAAWRERI